MIKVVVSDFWHVILFPKKRNQRGDVSDILEASYWAGQQGFWQIYAINEELMEFYRELKQKHQLTMAIFSSGSLFTAPEIQDQLTPVFDKMISVSELGIPKSDPVAFSTLAKQFGVEVDEVLFIDDTPANVASAKEGGMQVFQFESNHQAMAEITRLLTKQD